MCSNIKEIMCLILVFIIGNTPINCSEVVKKQEMKGSLRIIELHQGTLLTSKETYATIIDTDSTNKAFYLRHRLKEKHELFPLEISSHLKDQLSQTSKPFNIATEDGQNARQCYNITSLQHNAMSIYDDKPENLMFEPQDVKIEQITSNNDRPPYCNIAINENGTVLIHLTNVSINIHSLFREDLQQLQQIRTDSTKGWKISVGNLEYEINPIKINEIDESFINKAKPRLSEIGTLSSHVEKSKIPFYKNKLFVGGVFFATIITFLYYYHF